MYFIFMPFVVLWLQCVGYCSSYCTEDGLNSLSVRREDLV